MSRDPQWIDLAKIADAERTCTARGVLIGLATIGVLLVLTVLVLCF
jgi:hypothetical protein